METIFFVCVQIHATPTPEEPLNQLEALCTDIVDLNTHIPFLGGFSVTGN